MKKYLLPLCFLSGFTLHAQAQSAGDIVEKAEDRLRGKSSYAEITIDIIRPSWTREMTMKTWSEGNDYALVLITAPAKDAGTVSLKRNKEVWNWLPSIERNIKLPPSMMSQSWMGTDFTNDDLVKESSLSDDYDASFSGDSVIGGRDCYRIILIPKPDAAVVWGKLILFIDKKDLIEMLTRFYDEDGMLVNTLVSSDIKMLGGKLLPARTEMIPADKPNQKTVLIYNSLEFDIDIPDNFFSVQNMSRVK